MLCLKGLDVLDKDTAITEFITLSLKIELAVEMAINFLTLAVVSKDLTENADTADPLELLWATGILSTTALTVASVAAKALSLNALCVASFGMHPNWTANNDAISNQLTNLLA